MNYWLTDFFIGGKDSFTSNSSAMYERSKICKKLSILFLAFLVFFFFITSFQRCYKRIKAYAFKLTEIWWFQLVSKFLIRKFLKHLVFSLLNFLDITLFSGILLTLLNLLNYVTSVFDFSLLKIEAEQEEIENSFLNIFSFDSDDEVETWEISFSLHQTSSWYI